MKTKLLILFTLATFVAGVFLFPIIANAGQIEPWNVQVDVVYGGKTYHYDLWQNAQTLTDEELQNRGVYLGIKAKQKLVCTLMSQGFSFRQSAYYVLVGVEKLVSQMQAQNVQRRDAVVQFYPTKSTVFAYQQGNDGVSLDVDKLMEKILEGSKRLDAPFKVDRAVTVEELKQQTMLRSTFTTTFNQANGNRVKNLQVCASKISGAKVLQGEIFSFNTLVGARTDENGFFNAKVILNGNYVDGVGGGVCQVASTLYNAVLLADLPVISLYQHSLVPSYVMPSFDAMVSYPNADFCFENNTSHALYLQCFVKGSTLTVNIFGEESGYQIERESVVLEQLPANIEYRQATESDNLEPNQQRLLSHGSDYVKSCGYLLYKKDGKLVKRIKIRQNEYKMSNKVVLVGR